MQDAALAALSMHSVVLVLFSTRDFVEKVQKTTNRRKNFSTRDFVIFASLESRRELNHANSQERGKKQPVSPGAAYRAASTNSESPYWRRGVVLRQDPLELFDMPLRIVRTAQPGRGHPDDLVEVPMLPPDHYGCGLECERFTGMLAAVEEHGRGCAH